MKLLLRILMSVAAAVPVAVAAQPEQPTPAETPAQATELLAAAESGRTSGLDVRLSPSFQVEDWRQRRGSEPGRATLADFIELVRGCSRISERAYRLPYWKMRHQIMLRWSCPDGRLFDGNITTDADLVSLVVIAPPVFFVPPEGVR